MIIGVIVEHLKRYCPSFQKRIAGSLNFDIAKPGIKLQTPSAILVYTGDDADDNSIETGVLQSITEQFDVILVLANRDEQGVVAADAMSILRAEVQRALVGWEPGEDYEGVTYSGGELLHLDRGSMFYRLGFSVETQLGCYSFTPFNDDGTESVPQTWTEREIAGLPDIDAFNFSVDVIGPIANPRPGPDGRIEFEIKEEVKSP